MKKDIQFSIKLYIPAGRASSAPPIGPVLGQYRLNLIEFCKDFNTQTEDWEEQAILPVLIIGYYNSSLEYIIKAPTTTFFLHKAIGTENLSNVSNKKHAWICTVQQLYELAVLKHAYNSNADITYNNVKTLHSTLMTMKVCVVQ